MIKFIFQSSKNQHILKNLPVGSHVVYKNASTSFLQVPSHICSINLLYESSFLRRGILGTKKFYLEIIGNALFMTGSVFYDRL